MFTIFSQILTNLNEIECVLYNEGAERKGSRRVGVNTRSEWEDMTGADCQM